MSCLPKHPNRVYGRLCVYETVDGEEYTTSGVINKHISAEGGMIVLESNKLLLLQPGKNGKYVVFDVHAWLKIQEDMKMLQRKVEELERTRH